MLPDLGCDVAQGYAIARPMPVDGLPLLARHAAPLAAGRRPSLTPAPAPVDRARRTARAAPGNRRQPRPRLGRVDEHQAAAEPGQLADQHAHRRPGDHDLHPAVRVVLSRPTAGCPAGSAAPAPPRFGQAPHPHLTPPRLDRGGALLPRGGQVEPLRPNDRRPVGVTSVTRPTRKVRMPASVPATRYQTPDFVTRPNGETVREDGGRPARVAEDHLPPVDHRLPDRAEVLRLRRRRAPPSGGSTTTAEPAASAPCRSGAGSAARSLRSAACTPGVGPVAGPAARKSARASSTVSPERSVRAPPTRDQPPPRPGEL